MQFKKCQKFIGKNATDTFTCKGKCGSVYHTACLSDVKKCVSSGLCGTCSAIATTTTSNRKETPVKFNAENMEATIKQINEKLEIVRNIETNTQYYSEKYDDLLRCHNDVLAALKETDNKLKDLRNRCIHLETVNGALESRVRALEQLERNKNLEIVGVKQEEGENLKDIVNVIAEKLEVATTGIERAWRLRGGSYAGKPGRGPPKTDCTIIVRFRTEASRDEWISKRKNIKTNKDIYSESHCNAPIFINEDLTKFNRDLLWQAKQRQKEKLLKYLWVKNGRFLCKKDDQDRTRILSCLPDLHTYVGIGKPNDTE
ncbi:hypothetical protein O0L34_g19078 [Tuta absoluta]|nr:hypothetical protein O0L34_g19078 [Tuta absoluta]